MAPNFDNAREVLREITSFYESCQLYNIWRQKKIRPSDAIPGPSRDAGIA